MINFYHMYFKSRKPDLSRWSGLCGDLADTVSNWLRKKGIKHDQAFIEPPAEKYGRGYFKTKLLAPKGRAFGEEWYFHVVIIDTKDCVHDPWFGHVVSIDEYKKKMFPNQELDIDIYTRKKNK